MNEQDTTTKTVSQADKPERSNQMNNHSKNIFSRTSTKIVLAVAIAAGLLAVLSGVVFNLDREIAVQSRVGNSTVHQEFASLPEYVYIQAHQANAASPAGVVPVTGFRALPEYGYIMAHSRAGVQSQAAILPAGMQNLAEYGYIQAHNQASTFASNLSVAATLPQGLRSLPIFDYVEAHSRPGNQTFVAGLPNGLQTLPEAGYIQMHSDD